MNRSRLALVGVALAVMVAALVWWWQRGDGAPAPASRATEAVRNAPPPVTAAPRVATASAAPAAAADPDAEAQPQAVPLEVADPGATPPPLDGKVSPAAPPQTGFSPAEVIAKREADLALLDETEQRLEKELSNAQASGDTSGAATLQIRLQRLRDLRDKRKQELDTLRAGGTLPP